MPRTSMKSYYKRKLTITLIVLRDIDSIAAAMPPIVVYFYYTSVYCVGFCLSNLHILIAYFYL